MRRFETIYIASPELPDEEVPTLMSTLAGAIGDGSGEVVSSEDWGKKKLAYEVKKHREGRFLRLEYTCEDPELPHELERRLRFNEQVIKFQTVRIDNDKKRLVWEAKQAEREKVVAARRAAAAAATAENAESQPEASTAPVPASASPTPESSPGPAGAASPAGDVAPATGAGEKGDRE